MGRTATGPEAETSCPTAGPRIVLLPGMGADARAFEAQRAAFAQLEVPAWIEPRSGESLGQYAGRLADTIRPDGPMILGGVSLGGMLAYEMAARLRPKVLVLIASCRDPRAIRGSLYRAAGLARWTPTACFAFSKRLAPWFAGYLNVCDEETLRLTLAMYRDADPWFLRWACQAIHGWRPEPLPEIPLFHIHGTHDRLIPVANVAAHVYVPQGGHLINTTHAEQVNDFLRQVVARSL